MPKLTEEQKKSRAETREKNKQLEKQKQEELRMSNILDRELKDLRKKPLPPARFSYKVGDVLKPRSANWNSLEVLEVLDEGKILKCKILSDKNYYGKIIPMNEERYLSHLEVLPENHKLSEVSFSSREKRTISFHSGMLDGLFSKHYYFGIDYSPEYQRELCWTLEDKRNLIKSIFNNIEIGKFAFIQLPYKENSPTYEILDGKQRLTALVEFYEDKFEYQGLTFSDLSRQDKNHFLNYIVTSGDGDENWTLEDKMEYFLKLNVSGVPQSQDHLEKVANRLKEIKSK